MWWCPGAVQTAWPSHSKMVTRGPNRWWCGGSCNPATSPSSVCQSDEPAEHRGSRGIGWVRVVSALVGEARCQEPNLAPPAESRVLRGSGEYWTLMGVVLFQTSDAPSLTQRQHRLPAGPAKVGPTRRQRVLHQIGSPRKRGATSYVRPAPTACYSRAMRMVVAPRRLPRH